MFNSVQSLDQLGCWVDMKDDSAQILSRSFLQEAIVSNSGMNRDAQFLTLSIQHSTDNSSIDKAETILE